MTISRKALAWGATSVGALVVSAGALTYAFNPQPDPPGHYFGLMGIVAGQHAVLHVSNIRMPLAGIPPDPCRADLFFVNERGEALARRTARVMPGQSVSLNFTVDPPEPDRGTSDPPGESQPPEPDRQLLRGLVLFSGKSGHCASSLEVTDAMGQSQGFMNPGTLVGFNPQPDPPGIVGR